MHRRFAALVFCWAGGLSAAGPVAAQHATAYDVEDGARVFASICAQCHGPDGNLIQGIDLGRGQFRRAYTDRELAGIISTGIPSTPMPPSPSLSTEQIGRIVSYLRSNATRREPVKVAGNPARGKALFEGKGECRDCHRVGALGSRLGPNLTGIGLVRRATELEESLLDPQNEIQPNNRFYTVVTADGKKVSGRLLNHDSYSVQLLDKDEQLRSFAIADLKERGFGESPMPSLRRKFSDQQIADLVSYLVSLQGLGGR